MGSPINFSRCKIISVSENNQEVGYGPKGQLNFVGHGFGIEFIVKPMKDSTFKFYRLIDGVQKLITVCDSSEVPYLTMMKENKNSIQEFQVSAIENAQFTIQCQIKGQSLVFTLEGGKVILSQNSGSESQKWTLQPL